MSTFKKEYTALADAIVTYAIVTPATKIENNQPPSFYYYTDNAAWDTGAQFSFISPRLVEALGLKPFGKIMTFCSVWISSARPTSSSPTLTTKPSFNSVLPQKEG